MIRSICNVTLVRLSFILSLIFYNSIELKAVTLEQVYAVPEENIRRVTRGKANFYLDVDLFSAIAGGCLLWKQFNPSSPTLEIRMSFNSDPAWNRIVYGDQNKWFKSFGEWGSEPGQYKHPQGLDISYRAEPCEPPSGFVGPEGLLFVADNTNDRVSVETFFFNYYNLPDEWWTDNSFIYHSYIITEGGSRSLSRPMDVAFDDNNTQVYSDDCLWVADTGNDRIVKYSVSDTGAEFILEYGSSGSGTGQFNNPISLCRGKNEGLLWKYLYVIDSANRRIVMLENEAGSSDVSWYDTYDYSGKGWQLKSIRSDWYGQIWVTDNYNSSIKKFTRYLDLLDEYGEYGLGQVEGKLNRPAVFSPSTMLTMTSAGQGIEVQEIARNAHAFSVEQWSDESGATAYIMGPDAKNIEHAITPSLKTIVFGYTLTDHCKQLIERVFESDGTPVHLLTDVAWAASGDRIISWDRRKSNGYMMEPGDYFLRIWMDSGYNDGNNETREHSFYLPFYYYEMCGQAYPYDRHWEDGTSWNWGDGHYSRIDPLGVEVKYKYRSIQEGLDPEKYYKVKATYYLGDDSVERGKGNDTNWKSGGGQAPLAGPVNLEQELWVDDTMLHDNIEIPEDTVITTDWYFIPPEEYQDGEIYLYFRKVAGGEAVPAVVEFIEIKETDDYLEPQDPDTAVYIVGTHQWGNRSGGKLPALASSDSISMVYNIDLTTGELVDSIQVGDEPKSLSSIKILGKTYLVVANSGSGDVDIIDADGNQVLITMDSGGDEPRDAIFGKSGEVIFVANYASSTVGKLSFDGEILGLIPVGDGPSQLALSPDGGVLYVQADLDNRIDLVDTGTDSLLAFIDLDQQPSHMGLTPGGRFMVVSHSSGEIISIVDTGSRNVIGTIPTEGYSIQKTIFCPDELVLFAIDSEDNCVLVYNTGGEVIDSVEVGQGPADLELAGNGSVLLVSNSLERTISRIDVRSREEILPRIELGEIRPKSIDAMEESSRKGDGGDGPNLLGGGSAGDLPKVFSLLQNYPNPFNPSTTIRYDIPGNNGDKAIRVLVRIFNIRGQLVRTLVDAEKEPGRYAVVWDGRNERGETVSSGIYLYRIEADTFRSIRKMVALR